MKIIERSLMQERKLLPGHFKNFTRQNLPLYQRLISAVFVFITIVMIYKIKVIKYKEWERATSNELFFTL